MAVPSEKSFVNIPPYDGTDTAMTSATVDVPLAKTGVTSTSASCGTPPSSSVALDSVPVASVSASFTVTAAAVAFISTVTTATVLASGDFTGIAARSVAIVVGFGAARPNADGDRQPCMAALAPGSVAPYRK